MFFILSGPGLQTLLQGRPRTRWGAMRSHSCFSRSEPLPMHTLIPAAWVICRSLSLSPKPMVSSCGWPRCWQMARMPVPLSNLRLMSSPVHHAVIHGVQVALAEHELVLIQPLGLVQIAQVLSNVHDLVDRLAVVPAQRGSGSCRPAWPCASGLPRCSGGLSGASAVNFQRAVIFGPAKVSSRDSSV